MEKKIEPGTEFFQTQAVYDTKGFETFARKTEGFGVPIQYGIVIVKSAQMEKHMNANLSGIKAKQFVLQLNPIEFQRALGQLLVRGV
jgi:5,10-methylenetetrahydrofolate reductase